MAGSEEAIIQFVAGLDESGTPISGQSQLLETGLLDSINLVQLIQFVEERFGIAIPDADIGPEIFATPAALAAYVDRRLG
jgi:acyl carrier protein